MVVISPHLDDAVFSCSGLLAGATVMTICAGIPGPGIAASHFDRAAGFRTAADAVRERRREDERALAVLGAAPLHLNCLDGTYAIGEPLAMAVARSLEQAAPDEIVVGPLGLRHPDHEMVAAAFRATVRARGLNAWLYEDLPYAALWPEYTAPALTLARCDGVVRERPGTESKRAAVACYGSQLPGMEIDALFGSERFHRLCGESDLPSATRGGDDVG